MSPSLAILAPRHMAEFSCYCSQGAASSGYAPILTPFRNSRCLSHLRCLDMGPAEPQATSLATLPIFLPCQATLKGRGDSFHILPALSWKPNLMAPVARELWEPLSCLWVESVSLG